MPRYPTGLALGTSCLFSNSTSQTCGELAATKPTVNIGQKDASMSAFDRDFGRQFGKVEQTVLIDDVAVKLSKRYPRNTPEIAQEHRLLVVDPTGEEWECPIRGEVMVGRAEDNDISLEDRAVSRHHMAINTDGKLFWYQDLNSGNGTQVNGEFSTEGWLTGGEELVVGNSRLYFMVPDHLANAEKDAPNAPKQDAAEDEQRAASSDILPQALPIAPIKESPKKSERSALGLIVFLVGFIALGGLGYVGYRYYYPKTQPPPEKKSTPLEVALEHFNRGKALMKDKKWVEADQALRMAASVTEGNPIRSDILGYVRLVSKELSAQNMLQRARTLYVDEDKPVDAMRLLTKIPEDTDSFHNARQLQQRIYKKEIQPKLAAANLAVAANQPDLANKHIQSILKIDPDYKEALDLKQKIEAGTTVKIEEKKPDTPPEQRPTRRSNRRSNRRPSSGNLQQGVSLYNSGRYAEAIIYFRRLESSGSSRGVRKNAAKYKRHVTEFQRNVNVGMSAAASDETSRAISHLSRAARADRSLGGGRRSYYARSYARVLHKRGTSLIGSKQYMAAFNDLKEASQLDPANALIKNSLSQIRSGAKKMLEEAQVLKDVDNNEAKRLLMQVMRILPSSDPLHQKAKQLLN